MSFIMRTYFAQAANVQSVGSGWRDMSLVTFLKRSSEMSVERKLTADCSTQQEAGPSTENAQSS